jgi:hypothetical protein
LGEGLLLSPFFSGGGVSVDKSERITVGIFCFLLGCGGLLFGPYIIYGALTSFGIAMFLEGVRGD